MKLSTHFLLVAKVKTVWSFTSTPPYSIPDRTERLKGFKFEKTSS
jgi:hypothetical protein